MAEKHNSTCKICGKSYYACMSCADTVKLKPWQIYCCSSDCYKTFQVVRGFSTGVYDKEEFKFKLKNIDLSNLDNYRDHIKSLIKDALKEEIVEVEVPIIEEVKTEEMVVENSIYSRKRNYKVNKVEANENVEVE